MQKRFSLIITGALRRILHAQKTAVMLVRQQFYVITMLLAIEITKTHSKTCEDRASIKRKLSLKSFRNNTGHWTLDSTIPPLIPGPDYKFYAHMGYYKFHPELKTWQEARDICASEGAHLAILNSDAESNLLKQIFDQYPDLGKFAFIGFHDLNVEGQYVTLFDEPLNSAGFTEFAKGQPDNHKYGGDKTHPGEDCGSITRDGKLNDLLCTVNSPFICEREI